MLGSWEDIIETQVMCDFVGVSKQTFKSVRSRHQLFLTDTRDLWILIQDEIFSILSSARALTIVILAGQRDRCRHSTTGFSENVVAGEASY